VKSIVLLFVQKRNLSWEKLRYSRSCQEFSLPGSGLRISGFRNFVVDRFGAGSKTKNGRWGRGEQSAWEIYFYRNISKNPFEISFSI